MKKPVKKIEKNQTPANSYPPAAKNEAEKAMLEEIVEKQKMVKK